jgi:hypothetical protein
LVVLGVIAALSEALKLHERRLFTQLTGRSHEALNTSKEIAAILADVELEGVQRIGAYSRRRRHWSAMAPP